MIIVLVVVLTLVCLLAGALLGYALRQRQELEQKDVDIEVLEHALGKEKQQVEFLKNDVSWLEDNLDVARRDARAHEKTLEMLIKEIENADHATA